MGPRAAVSQPHGPGLPRNVFPPPQLPPFPGSELTALSRVQLTPHKPPSQSLLACFLPSAALPAPDSRGHLCVLTAALWATRCLNNSPLELDWSQARLPIEQRAVEGRHPYPTGSGVKPGSKQMRLQDVLLNDSLTPLSLGFGPGS